MKQPRRTIWFVRHGERVDNVNAEWKKTAKRWDDPPLSLRGHVQAREVGIRLAKEKIDHVVTSPFTRCVQTTANILEHHAHPLKMCIEPGLGESLNACNDPPGRPSMEEIRRMTDCVNESYLPIFHELPPETGGDAGCSFRIAVVLRKIVQKFPTGNILVVSHGSPIAACHLELIGTWKYVGQCTIGKIVQEGEQFDCETYGCKEHLSDKENLRDVQSVEKAPLASIGRCLISN